jgi:hypothetical protein
LKTPQVAVPLGVHTGWNLRNPAIGSPQELFSMVGSYFPFPRDAVLKRYGDRASYLAKVRGAAKDLVQGRYLLERDLPLVEQLSGREWDFVIQYSASETRGARP